MNNTSNLGQQELSTDLSRWRRMQNALVWMWLVMFIITMLLAMVSHSGFSEFAIVLCTCSSLAAVWVTHAGLRDVHT